MVGNCFIPFSCSTTIMSMAPLSVAGLMEFQVFETESIARPKMFILSNNNVVTKHES